MAAGTSWADMPAEGIVHSLNKVFASISDWAEPTTILIPDRKYRFFCALQVADRVADEWKAKGANWRRVKRERAKVFKREMAR